jgi:tetratricopeptide (TPR) repeat protein
MVTPLSSYYDRFLDETWEGRLVAFERAWQDRSAGGAPPRWQDFLPPAGGAPVPRDFLFWLLATDIDCRIAAGMPALLVEPYLDDECLLHASVTLEADLLVALVRLEYQRCWQYGQRARLADYIDCFPELADALKDLRPAAPCPRCRHRYVTLEDERSQLATCPACRAILPVDELFPPQPAPTTVQTGAVATEPPSFRQPWRLGRYEVLGEIARGGMGMVLRARDPELNVHLAVKVVLPRLRQYPEAARRLRVEARITAQLPHPAIVPVHDFGFDEARLPFLVMRLVRGHTLEHLLSQRGSLQDDLARWVGVFEQVCKAVEFAHSRRVIHRDLKPSNVMVGKHSEVQVMDWGLAKVLDADSLAIQEAEIPEVSTMAVALPPEDTGPRTQGVLGTPPYMPPEQANEEVERIGYRADVFCLGGILCAILTGKPTYVAGSPAEVTRKAKRGDVAEALVRLDGCGADAELVALAKECLSPQVHDRPPDAREVVRRVAPCRVRLEQTEARQREEKRRRDELCGGVTAALAEARKSLDRCADPESDPRQWQAAVQQAQEAVRQARELLATGPATRELTESVDALAHEVEQAGRDGELLLALEKIRLGPGALRDGYADGARAVPLYRAALSGYGIDVQDMAGAAARVRSGRVREALVAALEEWALWTEDGAERRDVAAVLSGVETEANNLRLQWRAVRQRQDGTTLAAMAQAPEVGNLSPGVLVLLARSLVSLKECVAAEQVLLGAHGRFPNDFWVNHDLGMLRLGGRPPRPAQAEGYLVAAAAMRRMNPAVQVNLGLALAGSGEVDAAIRCFNKAIDLDRTDPQAHRHLGLAVQAKGDVDGAIRCFHQALTLDPRLAQAHGALGSALEQKKDIDGAIRCWRKAVDVDPGYTQAHYRLGLALAARGDTVGAIGCFRKALALDPTDPQVHYQLGVALEKDDIARAIACFRKAIDLDANFTQAHYSLGLALQRQDDLDGAVRCFERVIGLDANHTQAHYKLGLALQRKGNVDGAVRCFRRAAGLDPDNTQAHYKLGLALQRKGDLDGAIPCFEKAIELDPELRGARTSLAQVLRTKGDLDGAIYCLEQAIARHPDFAVAHNDLGVVLKDKGDLGGAVRCYRRALQLAPGFVGALTNLAEALIAKGDHDEAIRCCQRAVQLEADSAPAHHHLARAFLVRGQVAQAQAAARRCTDLLCQQDLARDAALQLLAIQTALLCQQEPLEMYAAACRLFTASFAAEPKLAQDLKTHHLYSAACCAARAAAGQGKDAAKLGPRERARHRKQSVEWLRGDLALWQQHVQKGKSQQRAMAVRTLTQWQRGPDLAGIRDDKILAALAADERDACRKLWTEVTALVRKVQASE